MGGRPAREVEQEYRNIMLDEISPDDWRQIVRKATEQARRGDTAARKFIADYLIGPPVDRREISGADGNALKILVEYVSDGDPNAE